MTVSLLKDIKLAIAIILFTVIKWPSQSNRPFIMRDAEDEFNLVLSTKILTIVVLKFFQVLV
jgi:hypothetical protein